MPDATGALTWWEILAEPLEEVRPVKSKRCRRETRAQVKAVMASPKTRRGVVGLQMLRRRCAACRACKIAPL